MYIYLAKIFPHPIRMKYRSLIKYCDIEMDHEKFIGIGVLGGLILGLIVSASTGILFYYPFNTAFLIFLATFFMAEIVGYLWLILRADAKGKFIEEILPDALMLMAMNIKSGMTTDRALIMSARIEFGPLEKELSRAGKHILAGKEVRYALLDMTTRIRSSLFDKTIRLIIEGIESGGELSNLLQQTAEDIQNTRLVQNEVKSSVLMYAIFIFFAVGFGAPLLFGISTHLVSSIGTQFSTFQVQNAANQAAGLRVSSGFLVNFALMALFVTSFFGSLIIGIVKGGSEKSGLKLIPVLIVLSFVVFFLVRMLVASVFPVLS